METTLLLPAFVYLEWTDKLLFILKTHPRCQFLRDITHFRPALHSPPTISVTAAAGAHLPWLLSHCFHCIFYSVDSALLETGAALLISVPQHIVYGSVINE